MIEPTDEMDIVLLREADGGPRAAVVALLAIISRDYDLRPRVEPAENPFAPVHGRCQWCGCARLWHTPSGCAGDFAHCPCEGWESEGTP